MSKFVFTGEDHTRPPHLSPLIVFGGDPCADNATTRKCNSVRAVLFNDGLRRQRRADRGTDDPNATVRAHASIVRAFLIGRCTTMNGLLPGFSRNGLW